MTVTFTGSSINSAGTSGGTNLGYKEVTVTAAVGDKLVAFGISAEANSSTTSTLTKSAGTGAITGGVFTILRESHPASECGYIVGEAVVSTAGTITVRANVSRSVSGAYMETGVWLIPAAEWSGSSVVAALGPNDADSQVSLTVPSAGCTVLYSGGDWDALTPGSTPTPTGGTIDASYSDGSTYAVAVVRWGSQAAGSRNYGMSGLTSRAYNGAVVAIPAGSGGGSSYPVSVAVAASSSTSIGTPALKAATSVTAPATSTTTVTASLLAPVSATIAASSTVSVTPNLRAATGAAWAASSTVSVDASVVVPGGSTYPVSIPVAASSSVAIGTPKLTGVTSVAVAASSSVGISAAGRYVAGMIGAAASSVVDVVAGLAAAVRVAVGVVSSVGISAAVASLFTPDPDRLEVVAGEVRLEVVGREDRRLVIPFESRQEILR